MSNPALTKPNPWARLWQLPLLVIGLLTFIFGVRHLAFSKPQVPFATHVGDIQTLINAKNYTAALQQIAVVDPYFQKPQEQAQLAKLSGDAFFFAEEDQPAVVDENCTKAITFYTRAAAGGFSKDPDLIQRWGLLAYDLKDYPTAIEKLTATIAAEPAQLSVFAHKLVKAYVIDEEHPPENARITDALDLLTKLLATGGISVDDRVWALAKRIQLTLRQPGHDQFVTDAQAALPNIPERNPAGILLSWIGRAQYEAGHLPQARQSLTDARARFVEHNDDDGRAALILGKIAQADGQDNAALPLYEEVIVSHAGSAFVPSARFGRAQILAAKDTPNDQMKSDYEFAIAALADPTQQPELLDTAAIRTSLLLNHQRYLDLGRFQDALGFLTLIDKLNEPETPDLAYRHAITEEKLAQEAQDAASRITDPAQKAPIFQAALDHFAASAEAYLRYSKSVTLDDEKSSAALWHAAALFDQAGRTQRAIDTYISFIRRPNDSRVPEALLDIGLLYQSLGDFDQAIPYHQRNMDEHPKTPASYLSTVQIARCYMAKGEVFFPQAEAALLSLVQDQKVIQPSANEFRISLFTLGELYYRTRRWSDAILRLQEAITRYPDDPAVPRATFWLADSYRSSALEIADAIRKAPQIDHRDELEMARQDRLRTAGDLFSKVITLLDLDPDTKPRQLTTLESEYLRFSYLYRADSTYDLGDYQAAIKLYDQTATRFSQNVIAIDSYVQIVNAYNQLKEPAQASAAAERASWVLKRIPDDAFGKGPLALSRSYYEDFLKLGQTP